MKFCETMDPCSRDVWRGADYIGSLQWHRERAPRFVPFTSSELSLDEVREILDEFDKVRGK